MSLFKFSSLSMGGPASSLKQHWYRKASRAAQSLVPFERARVARREEGFDHARQPCHVRSCVDDDLVVALARKGVELLHGQGVGKAIWRVAARVPTLVRAPFRIRRAGWQPGMHVAPSPLSGMHTFAPAMELPLRAHHTAWRRRRGTQRPEAERNE